MASTDLVSERPINPAVAIFALAMGGFAIGTSEFAAMALVPYFSPALGVNEAEAAHAISAYALGVVVGAPILAVYGARMSRRRLLIGLMSVYGVFNILAALAPTYGLLVFARFLAGLPHGAYFGVAALVAASLVAPNKRTQAISMLMIGLTIATIIGVPFANLLGQTIGWRWGFGVVGAIAALTAALVLLYTPDDPGNPLARPMRELGALKNRQVWLILLTGAIGFGGFFAIYTYMASMLLEVTMAPDWMVPVALAVFGAGMTVGTLIVGSLADKAPERTAIGVMVYGLLLAAIYPSMTGSLWTMLPILFLIGTSGSMGVVLQTRLMDVAGEAQTLAAALNHSAFNAANALGPALAAAVLTAGYGFPATGYVGVATGVAGILVFTVAVLDGRRR